MPRPEHIEVDESPQSGESVPIKFSVDDKGQETLLDQAKYPLES